MGPSGAEGFNVRMSEVVLYGVLALGFIDAAVLYATVLSRRVHQRRVSARIEQTRHLSAVVRTDLALQRGAI
jgi:hypothetical protein